MRTKRRSLDFPLGFAQGFGEAGQALDFARDDNGGKFKIFKVNIPTLISQKTRN